MVKLCEKPDCFGCGSCRAACPAGAIAMRPDDEGFLYPSVDPASCTDCGACLRACPAVHVAGHAQGNFYAVRCNDMRLLRNSPSGGAFSLLAQHVLARGGLVAGARFDADFRVHHVLSDDIAPMRKSKYVQSDMEGIHAAVRRALDDNREVLFTGTPCQCHGLRLYLDGGRSGLLLAALICRGVQSPGLWADYAAHLSADAPLRAYDFRDKRLKNDAHTVAYAVGNVEIARPMGEDRFSRLYMKCLTLRPSCYRCPYCRPDLDVDFSIGDFWGVEHAHPELADGMGTSLVIARGGAAIGIMDRLATTALVLPSPQELCDQSALNAPAKEPLLRKLLFRDYARKDMNGSADIPMILKKYGA